VLITGVNGQLGHDVKKRLTALGIESFGVDLPAVDITNKDQTEELILRIRPDVIVHCAAYTDVDRAEDEQEKCYKVNVSATRNIAEACKMIDAKMVYISSDYVFDGSGEKPHLENDPTNPINYYGFSKEKGEDITRELIDKYFIVRTSWLFGNHGNNFVKKMLELAKTKNEIDVVYDQIGSPTYSSDLATTICEILQTAKYGVYHCVNEGYCSWYEFAKEIFNKAKTNIIVNPIKSAAYPTKAKRPLNSRLSKDMLEKNGFCRMQNWNKALDEYFRESNESNIR
jgi:dTDP-4-dehydrorhamnose reductase